MRCAEHVLPYYDGLILPLDVCRCSAVRPSWHGKDPYGACVRRPNEGDFPQVGWAPACAGLLECTGCSCQYSFRKGSRLDFLYCVVAAAQMYIGDGAKLVRDAFQLARQKGPAIVFIDELDAIGTKRFDSDRSGPSRAPRTLGRSPRRCACFHVLVCLAFCACFQSSSIR